MYVKNSVIAIKLFLVILNPYLTSEWSQSKEVLKFDLVAVLLN